MLSRFWLLSRWEAWVNLLKNVKTCDKNLFSDSVEWSSKKLWKMISADGKTNVKQYEVKEIGGLYLINFCKKYLQNLTYNVNVKRSSILHLILCGVLSRLFLSVKNRGCEEGGVTYLAQMHQWEELNWASQLQPSGQQISSTVMANPESILIKQD